MTGPGFIQRSRISPRKPLVVDTRFCDSRGVPFDSYHLLPPLDGKPVREWPRITRVKDPVVCQVMHLRFGRGGCWECGAGSANRGPRPPIEAHHMAEGSAGKSDEFTLMVMLCRICHGDANTPRLPLGRLLYLKWIFDRANVDWTRLALLHWKFLPDLISERYAIK